MSGKHRRIVPRRRRGVVTVTSATLAAGGLLAGTASAAPDVGWDTVASCEFGGGNWAASTWIGFSGGLSDVLSTWPACGRHASEAAPARHAAPSPPKHAAPAALTEQAGPTLDYVVASGETLAQIAAAHAVPGGWQQIYDNNRDTIADPDVIVVGQHLKLPERNAAATPASKPTPATAPAVVPTAFTTKLAMASRAVSAALAQQGTPYVYGGNAPGGFDCSGLVQWIYKQAGITLPRTAAQSAAGRPVALNQLQPGDLLFFYRPVGHVVIYVGNGKIAEASQPGKPVHVRPMYLSGFVGARRVV